MSNLKIALIEYARCRPLIWDRNIPCTKKERENIWCLFAEGFNLQVSEVRKRWEGMRRMYLHELRAFLKSGKKSEWTYFPKLDSFLRKPVQAVIEKFSLSNGPSVSMGCIEISSNDEEDSPPAAQTVHAAPSDTEEKEQSTPHSSTSAIAAPSKNSVGEKAEGTPVSRPSTSDLGSGQMVAYSFTGETISIKPENLDASIKPENLDANENNNCELSGSCSLLSRLEQQGHIQISTFTPNEDQGETEHYATFQEKLNTASTPTNTSTTSMTSDNIVKPRRTTWTEESMCKATESVKKGLLSVGKAASEFDVPYHTLRRRIMVANGLPGLRQTSPSQGTSECYTEEMEMVGHESKDVALDASSEPVKLVTTEDVRNELRKIPPLKLSLTPHWSKNSNAMKLKRTTETHEEKIRRRKDWEKLRKEKMKNGVDSQKNLRTKIKSSYENIMQKMGEFRPIGPNKSSSPNKQKPCPLSKKKVLTQPLNPSSAKLNFPLKSSIPIHANHLVKINESIASIPTHSSLVEDISEYATLNPTEDKEEKEEDETTEKEVTSCDTKPKNVEESSDQQLKDSKPSRRQSIDSTDDFNLEIVRESRRNFLLSFLPDMDEMSAEQRKIFKSKLMNLICPQ